MNRYLVMMLACTLLVVAPARAQITADRIAGEVVSLDGETLRLRLNTGQPLMVNLPADARISGRSPAQPSDITEGSYVGVTATTQADGALHATEVHIFPASMRGTGEGHRPIATVPGRTMTNATVASTMTNASVAAIGGNGSMRTMTLKYRGGEQTVIIPAGIPIAMYEAADRTQVVPGAHVIVYARHRPDQSLVANRITVGLRGFVPPA